ncbi:MAG: response regulator [Verrucomicrobiota bacterium]|nr:response regulator [Verrucomicrobiota bacterium]
MVAEAHEPSRPWRIFLVEDHVDTARAISGYLRSLGHSVSVANDVRTARKCAGTGEFDILLSDLGLPDGNGWDLLRELRPGASFKAIAMSGYNTPEDLERSKAAGFLEHLAKPLVPEELEAAFARVMAEGSK